MGATKRVRRAAAIAVLLAAVPLLARPVAASADVTVAGSQYMVTFDGTAQEQVDSEWGKGEKSEQRGSWGIEDSPIQMWLPASADPAEELGAGEEYGFAGGFMAGVPRPAEPASITETGYSEEQNFTCDTSAAEDRAEYISWSAFAAVVLGRLELQTTYAGRTFNLGETSSRLLEWQCEPPVGGPQLPSTYPPSSTSNDLTPPPGSSATYTGDGGTISYLASVPFADVGQSSFTLPVTDTSTINQAPWWGEWEQLEAEWNAYLEEPGAPLTFPSHHFSIEGSYSFEKVCDGTIVFSPGEAEGSCGEAGGTPGPGSTPPPPGPTPPTPHRTPGARQCVVPALKGKSLGKARKLLASHHCKLGKVKKRKAGRSHRGKVLSQAKAAGRKLPDGTAVRITVGR